MASFYHRDDSPETDEYHRYFNTQPPLRSPNFIYRQYPPREVDSTNNISRGDHERYLDMLRSDYPIGTPAIRTNSSQPILPHAKVTRFQTTQSSDSHGKKSLKEKVVEKIPWHRKYIQWMDSESKNHTVAMLGEFVGTTLFLFLAFAGTQLANFGKSQQNSGTDANTGINLGVLMYISISFGFSLMVNAWIFFRISGGLFNPAVTLALALLRALTPIRAVLLAIAQMGGACLAAFLVDVLFPTPLDVQTTLGGGVSITQGLLIEALCTTELVFTILMLAKEKHKATFIAPVGIGLSLFVGEIVAVYYTGGSFNPARSFGPAAVLHDFEGHHWIYWVGPLIGTLVAVFFYRLVKILEYETANPGQDADDQDGWTPTGKREKGKCRHEEV